MSYKVFFQEKITPYKQYERGLAAYPVSEDEDENMEIKAIEEVCEQGEYENAPWVKELLPANVVVVEIDDNVGLPIKVSGPFHVEARGFTVKST